VETFPYLKEISIKKEKVESFDVYPFSIPVVKYLEKLEFKSEVTFIVGENGKYIRLVKSYVKPKDGFFLRAESYYNVATNIEALDDEPSFGPPVKDSYGGISLHEAMASTCLMSQRQHFLQ